MSTISNPRPGRVISIDAARGLVMFTMIYVNDISGVSSKVVPDWMRHYRGVSGMTFVDIVFPAFLFIVGMSIPAALGGRIQRGEPVWKTILHILVRTLSLLLIGVLMVNDEEHGPVMHGLSHNMWSVLMYSSAMLAFCSISPRGRTEPSAETKKLWQMISMVVRWVGLAGLVALAFMFQGDNGQRIITLSPFAINTSWFGILGLIGWSYLVGSLVYLAFRSNPVALLSCMVLLMALYSADKTGAFDNFRLGNYVGIGEMLGAHSSITVGGLLLASVLPPLGKPDLAGRLRFASWFVFGCVAAALLLHGLYGISKNEATPSWCLWSCAFTAIIWIVFHLLADNGPIHPIARVCALAGQNVLLAYLLSEMLPSLLPIIGADAWYGRLGDFNLAAAIARSAGLGVLLLAATVGLNRIGFRLRI